MKKLIINADDFGYSRGINFGIVDAHQLGVLTSTTFMTNMPGADHAAELSKQHQELGVGIHLVLTCGKPLLNQHKTIVDSNGYFRKVDFYKGAFTIDYEEVYQEWKAQIEKFLSYGLTPTHLDSHHHTNSFGDIPNIFIKLAKEYDLPVRNNMVPKYSRILQEEGVKTTDSFLYVLESSIKDNQTLDQIFEGNHSVEVMTHPGYLDKEILSGSSFSYPRVDELELLMSEKIIELFRNRNDIQLSTFKDI